MELYEEAIANLDTGGLLYTCYCTRAEMRASSAPHGIPAADRYPGTRRELTATESAERETSARLLRSCGCGRRAPAYPLRTACSDITNER